MPILYKHQQDGTFYTRYGKSTRQINHDYVKRHNLKEGGNLPSGWKEYSYIKGENASDGYEKSFGNIFITFCPKCGEKVFYYENENGSKVFFDSLGKPWPKHPCIITCNTNYNEKIKLNTDDLKRLHEHFKNFHLGKKYKCLDCDAIFTSEIELKQHKLEKHYEGFKCKYCNEIFLKYKQLKSHITSKHEKYRCGYCKERFTKRRKLLSHMDRTHGKHICQYCNKRFFIENELVSHVEECHGKYRCLHCNKRFFTENELKCHLVDVCEKYNCPQCNLFFNNKHALDKHELNEHNTPYKCSICGVGFTLESQLSQHISFHHPYECEYCKQRFSFKSQLRIHIDECGLKRYKWQNNKSKSKK